VPDVLREPLAEKVFFAHQDNWALPAIEVAVHEGLLAAEQLRRSI
jgi:hypothetical protein